MLNKKPTHEHAKPVGRKGHRPMNRKLRVAPETRIKEYLCSLIAIGRKITRVKLTAAERKKLDPDVSTMLAWLSDTLCDWWQDLDLDPNEAKMPNKPIAEHVVATGLFVDPSERESLPLVSQSNLGEEQPPWMEHVG